MLVLSRKVGESIQIGDNVRIIVNRISGNRITLAVDAPRSVKIVRGELVTKDDESAAKEIELETVGTGARRAVAVDLGYSGTSFAPRNAR